MRDRYDAIILGGGHNGLVCGSYLARAGLNSVVLERRSVIGGAAVTEEIIPGFRFSVFSYLMSLLHPKVIADFDLRNHGFEVLPATDMEAINYAISDEAQMRLLDAGTYGPALTAAAAKATPDQQKILVTAPDNVRRMLIINEEQAAQYSAKYDDDWNRFQLG